MLSGSFGMTISVWVCDPRHVWTAAIVRMIDVADVEDPDAAESFGADGPGHALRAAVDPAAPFFDGHEQQVLVDREIALAAGQTVESMSCGLRGSQRCRN
jgi:hypothetical protein